MGAVAIVAGRGALPAALAEALAAAGRDVVFAVMDGAAPDLPGATEVIAFRVERLGALFKELRARDVCEVAFAGGMARPRIDPRQFDLKTMRLAPRFMAAMKGGDDGLLRVVAGIFEGEGMTVRAAHEVAPTLLPAPGVLTRAGPGAQDRLDAARAAGIVAALSAADVGQGAVVAQGLALAVEALPGTDAMLTHVETVAGACRPDPDGARGVLFKGPKAGQDRRIDLPAIGPDTVAGAARAGLAGIALAEGGVMILNRGDTIRAADAAGLFVWVMPADAAP